MYLGFAAATCWFGGSPATRRPRGGARGATKIYPAVIAIVAAPSDLLRRGASRGRGLIAFTAAVLSGSIAWLWVGGSRGIAESLEYQLGRGFEFGSLYSGVQMLAAWIGGAEMSVVRDRAAWASVTASTEHLLPVVLPIQLATLAAVVWIFSRRFRDDGLRASGAAILAFIVTGKVFSPQYLIWLLPFVAVLDGPLGRRAFWLFAAGCGATLIAPALTAWYPRTGLPVILAYNLKNALFLMLLGLLAFGPEDRSYR